MGQQQLLLIVLGVIIVGIAVVVGINMFSASSVNANRDAVTSDLSNLAAMAQQHFRKPIELGGGGNAFNNSKGGRTWSIPATLDTTGNGIYTATVNADNVVIRGTGNEPGVILEATVRASSFNVAPVSN